MSNWYTFQQLNRHAETTRKRKGLVLHFIGAFILTVSGILLIRFTLGVHENHSLGNSSIIPGEGLPVYFTPSVRYWEEDIQAWGEFWSLDPLLIATVMQIESCGDPYAVSSAGAQGLFQVMPFHFAADEDMLDPQTNAHRGLAYLADSFAKSGGSIEKTFAGYNGGHGQINRNQSLWPKETQRYVFWGSEIYQDSILGINDGGTLTAWLEAGGNHLCQQAERNLIFP